MIKFSEDNDHTSQILAIGVGGTGASVIDKINSYNIHGIRTFRLLLDTNIKELKPFVESLPKAEIVFVISEVGGSIETVIIPHLIQLLRERSYLVCSFCTSTGVTKEMDPINPAIDMVFKGIKKSTTLVHFSGQGQKPTQTMIDFKKAQKGCFEKSEATVFGGIDLDVPTFMRKKR